MTLPITLTHDDHLTAVAIVEANNRGDTEAVRAMWPSNPSDLARLTGALCRIAGVCATSADHHVGGQIGTTLASYRSLVLRAEAEEIGQ